VLWPEDGREGDALGRLQPVDDVKKAAIDGGVIADHPDALPAQPGRAQKNIGTESDRHRLRV
jgi:hypothetical protein